jgi:hypothetical protein
MKKLFISLIVLVLIVSCKGPKSGPLVKESFSKSDQVQGQGQGQGQGQMPMQMPNQVMDGKAHNGQITVEKANVVVEPCAGCITIANLFENKQSLSGKVIKIKGQVTKYNPAIMGKNWVHIQDGTEYKGEFDLTITTDGQVAVGQSVTFEGKLALDKDFGYGYSYNVLLEEGKIIQ